ncbi:flagellar basal body protein [Notoacmeibacter ruber]|uniref:Flagellar basal body rod protein FlgB n=1 Tax=Notoacmeibacter ruber TaxID=2670375 RepID=A0A3L7JEB9_9HYPH|nr:flagellar basal body protein [Notoacmeibacter ruber]RLQ88820.1 flagellar basal body rod protein FlgB [Notoacmeibacter ruber]
MSSLPIFSLASKHAEWLTIRQQTVANNIANAETPDYKASEVSPFQAVLEDTSSTLRRTNPLHLTSGGNVAGKYGTAEVQQTENSVSIEKEIVEQTELRQSYELNTSIAKAFHRMILSVAKP